MNGAGDAFTVVKNKLLNNNQNLVATALRLCDTPIMFVFPSLCSNYFNSEAFTCPDMFFETVKPGERY